ncbi:MAG: ABC transporter substrate-binding protein [Nocardioidaceae bacterium]
MSLRPAVLRVACVMLAALCCACTGSGTHGSAGGTRATERPPAEITVGSYDFPESVVLAYVYADALAAKGYPVRVMPNLGTRELVDPALMNDAIQLVPEYAGSALEFMSLGRQPATSDTQVTHRRLSLQARDRGLVAAQPAPAQDNNAIVVTRQTAARYQLRTITDLASVAKDLVFGGPPECPERAYCLAGLKRTYGLHFRAFAPTDAGGPLTLQALDSGQIHVGLLFTTDPSITAQHLVVLRDDRNLQPAENITPLVSRKALARHGSGLVTVLNRVSARLSSSALRSLDARAGRPHVDPRRVADTWLHAQGLFPGREVVQ